MKTITPGQISKTNLSLIYHHIYRNGPVSQQDISYDLRLSRPTVKAKIDELETLGMIRRDGQIESDLVGRKAAAYSVVPDYRVAVGVELLETQVKILAVNLKGEYSNRTVIELRYANTEEYAQTICAHINSFIEKLPVDPGQVLGVSVSVQGLVSADGTEVTYGKILDCTGLRLDRFSRYLAYPCRLIHDAGAAAGSEMWVSPELADFIYLNVSVHLGAALIFNREIMTGRHGYAATIEHVRLDPKGKLCYCGKRGCVETFCSMSALLEGDEVEDFFARVRGGDAEAGKRWKRYLHHLARVINGSHLLCDTVFILGGYLAPYLTDADIEILYDEIEQLTPFPETRDYIRISKMPKHNITIGAALPYIREFLDSNFGAAQTE